MSVNKCFEKRLLRKSRPDKLKSMKALDMSARALEQAEKLMEHEFYEQVILYSYTSMFQGARALLFKDGIIEKSHYCVVEYLKENYLKTGKLDQKLIH
ncbi:MAG: HEPN domain-containing protein [Methanosarcinales archaeon]|nr:HEPN domain-containing protein [Methanosarcinales archaeon]